MTPCPQLAGKGLHVGRAGRQGRRKEVIVKVRVALLIKMSKWKPFGKGGKNETR
jgi:hypothetical protein